MSFLVTALSMAIAVEEPIGYLPEAEFLSLFSKMGYTKSVTPQRQHLLAANKLKSGSTEFLVSWSNHAATVGGPSYVGDFRAYAEFDLPAPLSKATFEKWIKTEEIERVNASSYLGGRITITTHLFEKDMTVKALEERTKQFGASVQKVKKLAVKKGGRQVDDLFGLGNAKFDPNFKLDWIEDRDIEFLRKAMGWMEGPMPGGGRGWISSLKFGKAPIYVNGMHGFKSVFLVSTGSPDKAKAQKFIDKGTEIKWADMHITPDMVQIRASLNSDEGMTANALAEKIETFARQVNELDLF